MKTGSVIIASKHCLLVCCAMLACSAYCLTPAPDEKATKEAQERMLQSISSHNRKDVRAHKSQGFFKYVGCKKGASISVGADKKASSAEVADSFTSQFGPAFGVYGPNVANRLSRELPRKEGKVLRIGQSCAGVPVFGSEIVVDVSKDNEIRSAIAKIATAPELSKFRQPSSIIGAPEAMRKAVEDLAHKNGAPPTQPPSPKLLPSGSDYDSNLVVFAPSVLSLPGAPALAWQIDLRGDEVRYFVDADSGAILLAYSLRLDALDRHIYDNENHINDPAWALPGTLVRSEGEGASENEAVDDAYDLFGSVYAFFHAAPFYRDNFDGNGSTTTEVSVNYRFDDSPPWLNAQFKEPLSNAYPHPMLLFGPEMLAFDIVGHEYVHGISENVCNFIRLSYADARGISEGLSDILGEYFELQNHPGNEEDKWLIGEDTPFGTSPCGAMRNMKDPEACGSIAKKSDIEFLMDCHLVSGILSKLDYLISDGDTFNYVTVAPLDADSNASMGLAAHLFYDAMRLLPSSSDFDCLYYALTQTGEELGFKSEQKQSVEDACEAVEIAPETSFVIKAGHPLARFTNAGGLIMYVGNVHAQDSEHLESSGAAFMVKEGGSTLLRLPYDTGELYIAGKLYTNASGFTEPALALKVKSGNSLVAFVTGVSYADSALESGGAHTVPAGSIVLTGGVTHRDVTYEF